MSQVIMIFLFPIAVYFYFFVECRDRPKYQKVFDDFGVNIKENSTLSNAEKKEHYIQMLTQNGYTITQNTKTQVVGEKKILSMSLLAMGIGAYFVGAFVYLGYYFWIQKPHVVVYEI